MSSATQQYQPDAAPPIQDDYISRRDQTNTVPVQSDNAPVEDPIDGATANSDEQLERDDKEAINSNNIVDGGRTRGAGPKDGYREPGDKEGLPVDDGRSAIAQ